MNWNNYGTYWNIDHIEPCCSFDLTIKENQQKCFNYKNCRPLLVSENAAKCRREDIYKKHKRFENKWYIGEIISF